MRRLLAVDVECLCCLICMIEFTSAQVWITRLRVGFRSDCKWYMPPAKGLGGWERRCCIKSLALWLRLGLANL